MPAWLQTYRQVGVAVGAFYDADGHPTPLVGRAEALAEEEREAREAERRQRKRAQQAQQQGEEGAGELAGGTPCNVRWTKAEGGCLPAAAPGGAGGAGCLREGQQRHLCAVQDAWQPPTPVRLHSSAALSRRVRQSGPPAAGAAGPCAQAGRCGAPRGSSRGRWQARHETASSARAAHALRRTWWMRPAGCMPAAPSAQRRAPPRRRSSEGDGATVFGRGG